MEQQRLRGTHASSFPGRGAINSVWKARDDSIKEKNRVKTKGYVGVHQADSKGKDFQKWRGLTQCGLHGEPQDNQYGHSQPCREEGWGKGKLPSLTRE